MMRFDYFDFCPTLKRMLREGADSNGVKLVTLGSNSTENNLYVLRELIRARKPNNSLEIGLANGASALTILASLKEFVAIPSRHTAIDPFQNSEWKCVGLASIRAAVLQDCFRFIEEYSSLALPRLLAGTECFDLIYVDGSHSYDNVFIDYFYSARLLKKNGIILFDDCTTGDVRLVIEFIRKKQKHILMEVDLNPYRNPNRSWRSRLGTSLGQTQLIAFEKLEDRKGSLNL
jgi:predicted O-methyltransferase YrrM